MLSHDILERFKSFDSATIFNAVVKKLGLPNEDYTDHRIRCLLPDTGPVVGYAVTAEVTTNDADSVEAPWEDYYEAVHQTEGPVVVVLRAVDSRPGRGASFGDGMARLHKKLGTVGVLVEGTVRDLAGIGEVGLPVWAWDRPLAEQHARSAAHRNWHRIPRSCARPAARAASGS